MSSSKNINNLSLKSYSIQIRFRDRVGFIADLSTALASGGYNILSMEMHKASSFSSIYIGLNHKSGAGSVENIFNILSKVPDVIETKTIQQSQSPLTDEINEGFDSIIGESSAIKTAINIARKVAGSDAIISLRGESGTGKEVFARAIHKESGRQGLFIPVNCAAMPESLLETELFGYEAGAFTGAEKKGKPGLFEVAANGSIFLDEIAEMPVGMQAKLLRVLQDKKVRRIGGTKETSIDVRIITATNKNIEEMVSNKTFREDLYFRINVISIRIPNLNDRPEDIELLAEFFLSNLNTRRHEGVQILSQKALNKICRHRWNGNVRELRNVIERASILSEADIIQDTDITFADNSSSEYIKGPADNKSIKTTLAEIEKNIIQQSLKKHSSIRQTAISLGISHVALINKIKKYAL